MGRQMDRQMERQIDRQMDRQMDTQKDRQMDITMVITMDIFILSVPGVALLYGQVLLELILKIKRMKKKTKEYSLI